MKSKHFDELPVNSVALENQIDRKRNTTKQLDETFCGVLILILALILALVLIYFLNHYLSTNKEETPTELPPALPQVEKQSTLPTSSSSSNPQSGFSKFEELEADSNYFKPLFTENNSAFYFARNQKYPPISLSKIAFLMSSSPKNYYLSKLYIDVWSTQYGSTVVKNTGIRPRVNIYWGEPDVINQKPMFQNLMDYNTTTDFNIFVYNEKNYHIKWALMIIDYMKKVPQEVEWFVLMDDDTLLFLDKIVKMLSEYKDPLKNDYFIHSPGERKSGVHIGNGGSSFIVSRRLMERVLPSFEDCVRNRVPRGNPNGDIKFDYCMRNLTGKLPHLEYGLFHMEPKAFRGDLTGFIEGYLDKMDFKVLHHLNKKNLYYLYSTDFINLMDRSEQYNVHLENRRGQQNLVYNYDTFSNLNAFNAPAHFARSLCVSNDLFLKKYAIKFTSNDKTLYGILNLGYSFVVFDSTSSLKQNIEAYLEGVEATFDVTEQLLYDELSQLLKPKFQEIQRFYNKANTMDPMHPSAFWQEYCSPTSLETVISVYVDSYQKIYVNFFNKSLISF